MHWLLATACGPLTWSSVRWQGRQPGHSRSLSRPLVPHNRTHLVCQQQGATSLGTHLVLGAALFQAQQLRRRSLGCQLPHCSWLSWAAPHFLDSMSHVGQSTPMGLLLSCDSPAAGRVLDTGSPFGASRASRQQQPCRLPGLTSDSHWKHSCQGQAAQWASLQLCGPSALKRVQPAWRQSQLWCPWHCQSAAAAHGR